jgi:hypothetical protein
MTSHFHRSFLLSRATTASSRRGSAAEGVESMRVRFA